MRELLTLLYMVAVVAPQPMLRTTLYVTEWELSIKIDALLLQYVQSRADQWVTRVGKCVVLLSTVAVGREQAKIGLRWGWL